MPWGHAHSLPRCPRDPPSHGSGMVGEWWAAVNLCAHVPPAAPHADATIMAVPWAVRTAGLQKLQISGVHETCRAWPMRCMQWCETIS